MSIYVQLASSCVHYSPHSIAQLSRNPLSVFADHMRVNRFRDRRTIGVAELLLTQFQRNTETTQQRSVPVTENAEAVAAGTLIPSALSNGLNFRLRSKFWSHGVSLTRTIS
jgi:hypothetical protein